MRFSVLDSKSSRATIYVIIMIQKAGITHHIAI